MTDFNQERRDRAIRIHGDDCFGGLSRYNVQTKAVVSADRWSTGSSNCDTMEEIERVVALEQKFAAASGAELTITIIDRDAPDYVAPTLFGKN